MATLGSIDRGTLIGSIENQTALYEGNRYLYFVI